MWPYFRVADTERIAELPDDLPEDLLESGSIEETSPAVSQTVQ